MAALLVLFVALGMVVGPRASHDWTRDHASDRKNPWGLAACRELLERLEVPTDTWDRPLTELHGDVGMLMLLDPQMAVSDEEQARLLEWVAEGGRLVLGAFGEGWGPLSQVRTGRVGLAGYLTMSELMGRLGLALTAAGDSGDPGRTTTRTELTRNVHLISVPSKYRLAPASDPSRKVEPIVQGGPRVDIAAGDQPVLMTLRVGRGTVHVLAEVEVLANRCIGREDNAMLAVNLALAGGAPDRVYFDEYHHPFGEPERMAAAPPAPEVDPSPLNRLLLGLLAVAVVYGLGRAQRFGAPAPPRTEERRSAADYVRAFAALYSRAHAREAALAMLGLELRRRMAHAAGTTPSAPPERLGERLARRGLPGAEIAALLAELEDHQGPLTDADLVRLARRIAQYERML